MGIWAYIGGLNHFGHPANHIGPIVLGIGGYMLNAIAVSIVFVGLMRILGDPPQARGHALYNRQDQRAMGLVARPFRAGTGIGLGYVLLRGRLGVASSAKVRVSEPPVYKAA